MSSFYCTHRPICCSLSTNPLPIQQEESHKDNHEVLNSGHLSKSIGGSGRRDPIEGEEREHAADDASDNKDDDEDFTRELVYPELVMETECGV
jgi:hypothetical protein